MINYYKDFCNYALLDTQNMIAKKTKTPLSGKVKINEIQFFKSVKICLMRNIEVIMYCILVVRPRNCAFVRQM